MIKQLIYVSLPAVPLDESDVEKILAAARAKNLERRITGFLLFDGTMFMQLIEGPPRAVRDLFDALRADTRHQTVQKIYEGAAAVRLFSNFSMAFAHLGGEADLDFGGTLNRRDARAGPDPAREPHAHSDGHCGFTDGSGGRAAGCKAQRVRATSRRSTPERALGRA